MTTSEPPSRGYMIPAKTSEWPTPAVVFDPLDTEFGPFTLDPCGAAEHHYTAWKIANHNGGRCFDGSTEALDGLAQPWQGRVFMNPPYGRTTPLWIAKAHEEIVTGHAEIVVALLKSTTDVRWWHEYVENCSYVAERRFIKGRIHFGDGKAPAPFPSVIVVWQRSSR